MPGSPSRRSGQPPLGTRPMPTSGRSCKLGRNAIAVDQLATKLSRKPPGRHALGPESTPCTRRSLTSSAGKCLFAGLKSPLGLQHVKSYHPGRYRPALAARIALYNGSKLVLANRSPASRFCCSVHRRMAAMGLGTFDRRGPRARPESRLTMLLVGTG